MNIKAFFQKIWATPPIHGLILAVTSAVVGALTPLVTALYTYVSNPVGQTYQMPTIETIGKTALMAAVAGGIGYAMKQGWLGGSGVSNTQSTNTPTK